MSDPPQPPATGLISEKLFAARTVLIFGEVSSDLARSVCAQLLALDAESTAPIRIVVHSQGGHVESADTIRDVVRFLRAPVTLLGTGWVASAGALIYTAVPHPRRLSLPNTRYLLHQPLGSLGGSASDVEIEAREIQLMRERLNRIFADATGQSPERIASDTQRNHWMTARDAEDYGLVSRTIARFDEFDLAHH